MTTNHPFSQSPFRFGPPFGFVSPLSRFGPAASNFMSPGSPNFRNPMPVYGSPGTTNNPANSSTSPDSTKSTSPETSKDPQCPDLCRCQRPQSVIMCTSCGHTFKGRVRSHCCAHPSQIYLMDNESCPQCRSTCLREYYKS